MLCEIAPKVLMIEANEPPGTYSIQMIAHALPMIALAMYRTILGCSSDIRRDLSVKNDRSN